MTVGFRTMVSGAPLVQLDLNYSNYVEAQRGAVSGVVTYLGGGDQSNLVFVRPHANSSKVAAFGPAPGGQTGQGVHPAGEYFMLNETYLSGGCDYIVYSNSERLKVRPGKGTGLLISSPDGRPRYYSGWNYLKVIANPQITHSARLIDINLPAPTPGARYYVCINNLWLTRNEIWDEYGYFASFLSDTVLRVETDLWASEAIVDMPVRNPPAWHTPSIMIAEVL